MEAAWQEVEFLNGSDNTGYYLTIDFYMVVSKALATWMWASATEIISLMTSNHHM